MSAKPAKSARTNATASDSIKIFNSDETVQATPKPEPRKRQPLKFGIKSAMQHVKASKALKCATEHHNNVQTMVVTLEETLQELLATDTTPTPAPALDRAYRPVPPQADFLEDCGGDFATASPSPIKITAIIAAYLVYWVLLPSVYALWVAGKFAYQQGKRYRAWVDAGHYDQTKVRLSNAIKNFAKGLASLGEYYLLG